MTCDDCGASESEAECTGCAGQYLNNHCYDGSFKRIHQEDLEALSKKKGWRKWCPITVEIA